MLEINLPVELHINQEAIHASKAKNIVCKIGKRFGKSYLAAYKMAKWAGARANGMFWYLTDTYAHCKSIAWGTFMEILPRSVIKRKLENELEITLINDSKVRLIGTENQESTRGPKLHGAVFDEASYIDPYIWNNIIRGQLLGVKGEPAGPAFFISSPNKIGRNWYSNFYEEALRRKQLNDPDWDAFHYTIYDNPLLSQEDIEKIKEDSTEDEWNTEYMANESAHAGVIYSEFDFSRDVHERGLLSISAFVRGVDWGIAHPTVCLFAQVDIGSKKIYIEDEYVKSGFTIEESCMVIKKMTGNRPVDWTVCDPSLNKRNSQTKRTDKQEFDRNGVWCISGDNSDVGYNITKMFFKKGMIAIHPKCRNLIKELKTVQCGDEEGEDCVDTLRYLCKRLHDTVFQGVFKQGEEKAAVLEHRAYNLKDPILFPQRQNENQSEVRQEVNRY